MARRPRPPLCEGASTPKMITRFAFDDSTHGASHFPQGGKCDGVLGSCGRNVSEVPERRYPNRMDAGHGEMTQGSAGTKNSRSITVLRDEDIQTDTLGSSEGYSISLLEDDGCTDNTLWILENDGFLDRKSLSSDQGAGAQFGGTAEDLDDSSESLSCWSTASGPSLAVENSPAVLCKDCVKLFTKMKKMKNWKNTIDYDPTSLSCETWVLKKRWHPRRCHNVKGRLWAHLYRIRKADFSKRDPVGTTKTSAFCSRPPVFLQRNLARCKSVPVQSRRQVRGAKTLPVAKRRHYRKRSTRRKPCRLTESVSLAASLPTGSDTSVRVADSGIGQKLDRACRVLDFDKTEPLEMSGESLGCNATQLGTQKSLTRKKSPREFSWVGEGGFRSMLSQLQKCRSTVVEELHNSMS